MNCAVGVQISTANTRARGSDQAARRRNEHNPTAPNTTHRHKHRVLLVRALQEAPVHAHRADGAEDAPGRNARVTRAQVRPAIWRKPGVASSQERAHAVVHVARAQHAVPEQRAHERCSRRVTVGYSQAPRGLVARGRPGGRAAGERSRGRVGGRAGSRSSRRASGRAGRQAIERAGGRASGAAELRRCTIFLLRRRPWRPFGDRCEVEVGDRKRLANGRCSRGDAGSRGPTSRWRWRSAAAGGRAGDDAATEERWGMGMYEVEAEDVGEVEAIADGASESWRPEERRRSKSRSFPTSQEHGILYYYRRSANPGERRRGCLPCEPRWRAAAPMAFILVHEVQHCNLLVDNHHLSDQKALDGRTAYGFQQVQTMTSTLKKLNPQNYAFLALMMQSNPELFAPTCFIGSPLGTRAPDLTCRGIVQGFPGDVRLDRFENDDYVVRLVAVKEDVSHVLLTQLGVLYSTLMRWIN
ncbi:hypothetical protein GGX14DRAFT_407289 [Mycena pura]|uniref:Uncharacterized protein n=1 Tax=Mycena pura TaxID=153505 RepID=A0AAD6UNR7_9AGAR|nr:hypothetical protein GGX14DRAFT_407289 [Mycena pura]